MVQHGLKEGGVALQGHALILVLEIAVVLRQEDRHPGSSVGIDLIRGLAPLLHGVVDEHVLIDVVGHLGQLRVLILAQLQDGDLLLCAVGGDQLLPQTLPLLAPESLPQGGQVEGHRHLHPAAVRGRQVGHHPVLVVPPPGEAAQIAEYRLVIGVENMGAVLVDQHARLIQPVIGVAADVVPALQHQDPLSAPLSQLPGTHRAGIARTHHQGVKIQFQGVSHLFLFFGDNAPCRDSIS